MEKFKKNPRILIVIPVLAILFGSWLIVSSPARKAEKSLDTAKELLALQIQELEKFNPEFKMQINWYKTEYMTPITILISTCQDKSIQASKEIESAENSGRSKDKRAYADKAQAIVQEIAVDLAKAREQISIFEKMTARARKSLEEVNALVPEAILQQTLARRRITEEGPQYLAKYVNLNQEKLNQVQSNLSVADEARQSAFDLLPVESSSEHLGDPNRALELVKLAEDNIASAKTNAEEIVMNFAFYLEATVKAEPSIDNAKKNISLAANYLDSLVNRGPLQKDKALKVPFDSIVSSNNLLAEAIAALETLTDENKYDLPLAYQKSLESLKLAKASVTEADRQVALFTEATKSVKQLRTVLASLEKSITGAKTYQEKLNNHARHTWDNVAGNVKNARENLEKSKAGLPKIDSLIESDQSYEVALTEIKNSLALVDYSESMISNLIQLAKDLEDYRSNWPSAEREANRAINNEESNIDSYGSYSSSDQSDFDSAKNHLSSARSLADNREYQEAVNKAKKAVQLASGTGDRAYEAYRDHKRREEAAQQAANDFSNSFGSDSSSSSSSDYSSGGGWSDNSSSSSYSSDSGGWSGSSSSDSGGWSGSSSSSDGGGW